MPERYLDLGFEDRREVLDVAASALGRPSYLIEKDIWVVWAVETLFASSFGTHLVFKGGTSLSKAYRAIRRYSEDIADMLSNGDSAAMIGAVYPRISEVQIELAAFYARAYPRRGRPPKSLFWRTRRPTESSETSLDDLLV